MERIAEVEKGSLQTKCERKWEALGATIIKQARIEARHNSRIARVLETNKEGILICAAYPRMHHSHVFFIRKHSTGIFTFATHAA